MSIPLIAHTQAPQVPWLASTRRSKTSHTEVVAKAYKPMNRSRSVVLIVAAIASGARLVFVEHAASETSPHGGCGESVQADEQVPDRRVDRRRDRQRRAAVVGL